MCLYRLYHCHYIINVCVFVCLREYIIYRTGINWSKSDHFIHFFLRKFMHLLVLKHPYELARYWNDFTRTRKRFNEITQKNSQLIRLSNHMLIAVSVRFTPSFFIVFFMILSIQKCESITFQQQQKISQKFIEKLKAQKYKNIATNRFSNSNYF